MTFAAPTLAAICPWNAGTRTADRADSHGHRPQNQADLPKHRDASPRRRERSWQGDDVLADQLEAWLGSGMVRDLRPLPGGSGRAGRHPRLRRVFAAATAAHRVWPVRREPEARPNAIPEITNCGVSARPRRRDVRVGGAAS